MDAKTFFLLVSKMRDKQKEYFKTRSNSTLTACKKLEKEVDEEIMRVNNILDQKKEPTLF